MVKIMALAKMNAFIMLGGAGTGWYARGCFFEFIPHDTNVNLHADSDRDTQ